MSNDSDYMLKNELKSAGASNSEIDYLIELANSFKQLKNDTGSSTSQVSLDKQSSRSRIFIRTGTASLIGLAIIVSLVVFAQTVLPGSFFYPVQKASDNLAVAIDSNYRGTLMMKRAQQIKQLVNENANSKVVLATLGDYRSEAMAYKSSSTNYAVFEYCKTNLEQAAANAPSAERQAINGALSNLDSA